MTASTPRDIATETVEHWLGRHGIPPATAHAYALEVVAAVTAKGVAFIRAAAPPATPEDVGRGDTAGGAAAAKRAHRVSVIRHRLGITEPELYTLEASSAGHVIRRPGELPWMWGERDVSDQIASLVGRDLAVEDEPGDDGTARVTPTRAGRETVNELTGEPGGAR